ncbi:Succinate dehydrogenase hydrophobic membrane anchor protein [Caenispirillum salinarum AK4]|uniref:Succinate dehydrogenase hydrophobic membrane anchor subunit n=1 Tax=Caenispirillum salinarum AK4 TaxID=1238182 RepID=K9H2Y8_9PROT|nr:succinate dehydrogenase, hydrophobic membrane anchor protein [Caenispirillum salinarum]EKV31947.1 Succinate dehydrogenase hydrophobic membrane anchor protein [Caenispirillum salinarum AK4]
MSLRSPLGRVRGLGSAKEGVGHWIAQRVSAVGLIVLGFWFVTAIISNVGGDYATFTRWLSNPGNATMMILTIGVSFWHMALGLQVVIEDYVHGGARAPSLIAVKLVSFALAAFGILSVLKVAFGG